MGGGRYTIREQMKPCFKFAVKQSDSLSSPAIDIVPGLPAPLDWARFGYLTGLSLTTFYSPHHPDRWIDSY
jgi:hypothetical protein